MGESSFTYYSNEKYTDLFYFIATIFSKGRGYKKCVKYMENTAISNSLSID